jgi:hypothetical protein
MQSRVRLSLAIALALIFGWGLAAAEVPHHKVVSIKPQKQNGRVAGAKLLVTIHSTITNFPTAKIGLVRPSDIGKVTRETAGSGQGLVLQAPEVTNLKLNEPVEQEIVLPYGDNLKSGEKLRVLSAWPTGGTNHVFGAVTTTNDLTLEVTLP